jgi:hypothetical protein
MRTLLRHTQTGSYFQGPGKWTDDPEGAYDFRFIDRAVRYIETWDLREVELVFACGDPVSITMLAFNEVAPHCVA